MDRLVVSEKGRNSNPVEDNETIAAYDEISSHYEDYSLTKKSYLEAIDQLVIDRVSSDDSILDVGSGDGRRLAKISKECGVESPVAIEPSGKMAALCREKDIEVHNVLAGKILDQLGERKFSRILALWNVFGHIPSHSERLKVFQDLKKMLLPGGKIIFDLNNRHNAAAYGSARVLGRRLIDLIRFDEKRGDASYNWDISGKSFASMGHLFVPFEVSSLLKRSGLEVEEVCSVNYATGCISKSLTKGQLFYVIRVA